MSVYILGSYRKYTISLANATTYTLALSGTPKQFRVSDLINPENEINVYYDGTNLRVSWIDGVSCFDDDVANKLCVYLSGNVILKNNLGTTKDFLIEEKV